MARATRSCPECGVEVTGREAGCPRCGHLFQTIEPATPTGMQAERASTSMPSQPAHGGSTGWKTVSGATCGCFVLVALAGAAVAWLARYQLGGIGEQFTRVQQEADLIALRAALEAWADDHDGLYPERLEQLVERNGEGPWIEALPTDRWARPFVFEPPPDRQRALGQGRLLTLGSDGEPGGEGGAADLDEVALGLRPSPR